jgi:O-antigen ligase
LAHESAVGHDSHNVVSIMPRKLTRQTAARLLERIIFVGCLIVIAFTAIPYGSVEFWWTSAFEIAVFALVALWALQALLFGSYETQRWSWLAAPAGVLILFSLVQAIPLGAPTQVGGLDYAIRNAVSADPFETRSFALRLGAFASLAVLLLRFTNNRARLEALALTVVGVGALSGLFGITRQAIQHGEGAALLRTLPPGIGYGQIINRNQFALMMEMSFGVALGMIFVRNGGFEKRLFYVALALPIAAALILANSRGGILTMMSQLLLLSSLLVSPRRDRDDNLRFAGGQRGRPHVLMVAVRSIIVVALLGVASLAIVWVGGERVTSNLSTVTDELRPESEPARWNTRRVDIWKATWLMIKDHPVLGVGFGGYWIAVPRFHDASGAYTPQQAHNDYLETLASGGLLGFAILCYLVVIVVRQLRKTSRQSDYFRRAVCRGAFIGLCGVAIHSIFDFGLHITINGALCVALVVIGAAEIQSAEKEMHLPR